jgi:hypothetical protein
MRYDWRERFFGGRSPIESLTIDFSTASLTNDQFYYLCRQNEGLRFEMNAQDQQVEIYELGQPVVTLALPRRCWLGG